MKIIVYLFLALIRYFNYADAKGRAFQGFIIGGTLAKIGDFPHSAFMAVMCLLPKHNKPTTWSCGGSIINQVTILSAAHCLYECLPKSHIVVKVGNENKHDGRLSVVRSWILHEKYSDKIVINDLSLILLKNPIKLSQNAQRIALMKNPPTGETVEVAGWGRISEAKASTVKLKAARQRLVDNNECIATLRGKPQHTICARPQRSEDGYVAQGDSGSALLVRRYIQVGIVSYRDPDKSKSLGVYTYLPDYIPWIKQNVRYLYCHDSKK